MSISFIQNKVYPNLPILLQNLLISAYGLMWYHKRYGGSFESHKKAVFDREYFSKEQWDEYQTLKLRKLLVHAYNNIPLYYEKYRGVGLDEEILSKFTLSDLPKLPFLEKEELREFGTTKLLISNKSKGTFISSSGSTGTPTRIFLPKYFHQKWYAFGEVRMRNWAGVDYKTPRGMIGGRRILPDSKLKPPYYRYNFVEKQTYFSAYHISPETVRNYVEGMVKNKVEYMTGYAMSNFLLAKLIEEQGVKAPVMKAVITSSEKLTPEMRNTLERVYKCEVFDSYSGCEACGLISESPNGDLLFSPDTGIMEFIKEDGTYSKPGEMGEIVSTGLHNYDQPLIRYRIGDLAELSKNQLSKDGHNMPIIDKIVGRVEDVIHGKDGRIMVRFHGIFIDIVGLKVAQIVQHDYTKFTLRLVTDKNTYNKKTAKKTIVNRMVSQLGEVSIIFDYPNHIEAGVNGKIKSVISELM